MKLKLILLVFLASLALSGCATDPEDNAFFDRGWTHPAAREAGMQ
jgi:hypothetical protein